MKEKELRSLLSDMSLEEKINQLNQIIGAFLSDRSIVTGPMAGMGLTQEDVNLSGSVLGMSGAELIMETQKQYMEQQPHHIPLMFMLDVINGYKTIYPIPLAQGATFDPELAKECAAMAAKEAAVGGIHVTFSPMCDLVRDARWGRVMESTGEDPYLNGLFAEAMVQGYQGEDLKEEGNIAACVKHFAGYGAPTAGRDYNTVELSEHTLRQFYLPAYEKGIQAGAAMVMSSFNTLEGVPVTGNTWVMQDILRNEMKFDGVVISDWAAIEEMIYHGYCEDRKDAARKAMAAGVDIDMMTGIYSQNLAELIREGTISEETLDNAVYRILKLKNRLGLFENPYKDADPEKEKEVILCEEHRALARKAAAKSFVLLKNEGLLPLGEGKKTAYIGPYVERLNLMGSWSIVGEEKAGYTLKDAVVKSNLAADAEFSAGCPMIGNDLILEGFTESASESVSDKEIEQMLKEAVAIAKEADQVVLAIGEDRLQSGEATSNANIQIPLVQQKLLEEIAKVNENIVVVLFCGRPLDIRAIHERAKSILVVWMPGTEGAGAIVDVISGKCTPEGKLPMSFPYSVGQVPVHYNEYSTGRPHVKGKDKDRFRSKYLDIPNEPLFPFGYGKTYTSFSISEVDISSDAMRKDETMYASVVLKNTGTRTGTETVQFYIRDIAASVVRPVKELKAFKKVTLDPGQEENVTFQITTKELSFVNRRGETCCETGEFEVFIGDSSATENSRKFTLID